MRYGNPQCNNVTFEVFNIAILIAFHGEEDLSNQIRQTLNDATLATLIGKGKNRFDEAGTGALQEVGKAHRRGPLEEVSLAEGTGAGDADA